jgi:phage/plasmid primase-like uncharacterized protein
MATEDSKNNGAQEITYLDATYKDRKKVRELGGEWDSDARSWYVPKGKDLEPFSQWLMKKPEIDAGPPEITDKKVYLSVKYEDRHEVKKYGATWDSDTKSWFVSPGTNIAPLKKWIKEEKVEKLNVSLNEEYYDNTADAPQMDVTEREEKIYLNVPFADKEEAKLLGAKWDTEVKSWFVPGDLDLEIFAKWEMKNKAKDPDKSNIDPTQEFKELLISKGFQLDGDPVLDGNIHRVALVGAKIGTKDGAYWGHLDGRPNGELQNFKTGEKVKWKYTGQKLSASEIETLKAEREEKLAAREREREREQKLASLKAQEKIKRNSKNLAKDLAGFPYLQRKGITAPDGVFYSTVGDKITLLVPGYSTPKIDPGDPFKSIQTIQSITEEGAKIYEKGCAKTGAMFLIDREPPDKTFDQQWEEWRKSQENPDDKAVFIPKVLIAEGFATAQSLHEATGLPVACAFDAGNLEHVGATIARIYPGAHLAYCADNDHLSEKNIGVQKAQEAASKTGGIFIVPEFTQEEIANKCTDFNDIACSRGKEEVRNQIGKFFETYLTKSLGDENKAEKPKATTNLTR